MPPAILGNDVHLSSYHVHSSVNDVHRQRDEGDPPVHPRRQPPPAGPPDAGPEAEAADAEPVLWFGEPDTGAATSAEDRRPALTKERVVAEALTLIAHDGTP